MEAGKLIGRLDIPDGLRYQVVDRRLEGRAEIVAAFASSRLVAMRISSPKPLADEKQRSDLRLWHSWSDLAGCTGDSSPRKSQLVRHPDRWVSGTKNTRR